MNSIDKPLTNRESQVYNLLLKGLPLCDIADIIGTTRSTVATHVLHLYNKFLVNSRQELMAQRIDELEKELENFKRTKSSTRA